MEDNLYEYYIVLRSVIITHTAQLRQNPQTEQRFLPEDYQDLGHSKLEKM